MKRNVQISLDIELSACCSNCKHIQFPDVLEDVDYGTCTLSSQTVKENEFCQKWEVYSFWEDLSLDWKFKGSTSRIVEAQQNSKKGC